MLPKVRNTQMKWATDTTEGKERKGKGLTLPKLVFKEEKKKSLNPPQFKTSLYPMAQFGSTQERWDCMPLPGPTPQGGSNRAELYYTWSKSPGA